MRIEGVPPIWETVDEEEILELRKWSKPGRRIRDDLGEALERLDFEVFDGDQIGEEREEILVWNVSVVGIGIREVELDTLDIFGRFS